MARTDKHPDMVPVKKDRISIKIRPTKNQQRAFKIKNKLCTKFQGGKKNSQEKAPHLLSDKVAKRYGFESFSLVHIHSHISSLDNCQISTMRNLLPQLLWNQNRNNLGTLGQIPRTRPRIESKTSFQEKVCPYKVVNTFVFAEQKKALHPKRWGVAAGAALRPHLQKSLAMSPPRRAHTEHTHGPRSAVYKRIDSVVIGKAHGLTPHMTRTSIHTKHTQTHTLHIDTYIYIYTYMYTYICTYINI